MVTRSARSAACSRSRCATAGCCSASTAAVSCASPTSGRHDRVDLLADRRAIELLRAAVRQERPGLLGVALVAELIEQAQRAGELRAGLGLLFIDDRLAEPEVHTCRLVVVADRLVQA